VCCNRESTEQVFELLEMLYTDNLKGDVTSSLVTFDIKWDEWFWKNLHFNAITLELLINEIQLAIELKPATMSLSCYYPAFAK